MKMYALSKRPSQCLDEGSNFGGSSEPETSASAAKTRPARQWQYRSFPSFGPEFDSFPDLVPLWRTVSEFNVFISFGLTLDLNHPQVRCALRGH
jgi:hypothetical protein